MEERKLTKADIDKVRHIEGFPIAKDEDIIALSRPPYYTACPNPFIEEYIQENGTPYDEEADDYHREPFAADVSEGKTDPFYMAHGYHTKVPYKAIMRYILHYTKPGDIVFDGFCGSGMTGVAAEMCEKPDQSFKWQLESEMANDHIQWGARNAILCDLAPAATFISSNNCACVDVEEFKRDAEHTIAEFKEKCAWLYKTQHVDDKGRPISDITGNPIMGNIIYTVWSDVFVCPSCSSEIVYYDSAYNANSTSAGEKFACPHCKSMLAKTDCARAVETVFDKILHKSISMPKQRPVLICYEASGKRHQKTPDENDLKLIEKIEALDFDLEAIPMMHKGGTKWGDSWRAGYHEGISYSHQFYTTRNLYCAYIYYNLARHDNRLLFALTASNINISRMYRFRANGKGGNLSGTLYISSTTQENNVISVIDRKLKDIVDISSNIVTQNTRITCQSSCQLSNIPENSIDYIFTDPPFGGNLNYSELSFLWEAWLKVYTNNGDEAIINSAQKKGIVEYQHLMERCFKEFHRILKPGRWITIEFHNSQNSVWNAIQESLSRVGFIMADVRTLDKQQGSYKQVQIGNSSVKQDLVISAYKPRESFVREFQQRAGDPEMAWAFVRQHLRNVPVTADGNHDGKLDIISERQDYLLFDRMVAWHIMNGIPVPMDAHTFYEGLRQRFLERDGMFFLPDQVNEYDGKRAHMELDTAQLSFIVTDEKNAIQWLNYILAQGPMTYQEIQPLYMQELHQSRQEKMPELLDMLKENFVQDDKGAWYVPDLTNAADLAKVRRKALLKEFWDSCATGRGKLKVFRMEAIRAGFDECWKTRDFKTIVAVGERLPEAVLQEDPALLMYYDNACSRV